MESETCLWHQAQAITIGTGKVNAQMKATQKIINDSAAIVELMRKENEQGNIMIIRSIQLVDTPKSDLKPIKTCIKAYGNIIQHWLNAKITSPTPTTTSVTLSNDIKEIQLKLDKMKMSAKTTKEIVKKEGIDAIAWITSQVATIFNT